MRPIELVADETWTVFRRGPRDRTGDAPFAEHGEIDGCAFDEEPPTEVSDRRESQVERGSLYVPKRHDVLATDKLRSPDGVMYRVIGGPKWNKLHPMTGWDSGFKLFRLEGVS